MMQPIAYGRFVGPPPLKVVHFPLGTHVVGCVSRSPVSPLKQIPEVHSPFSRGIQEHRQRPVQHVHNVI
eukprot:4718238-Prymnesium_polylepis.1